MKTMFVLLVFACALAAAGLGCNKGKSGSVRTEKIGGCEIETVAIGTGIAGADEALADAAWIRVGSVDFSGKDVYKKAAFSLKELVESQGVKIYGCTELRHVKEGPCWPPYSVEYKIALTEAAGGRLRTFLMVNAVADRRPTIERPENYGPFFVSCGMGESDWWTIYYQ